MLGLPYTWVWHLICMKITSSDISSLDLFSISLLIPYLLHSCPLSIKGTMQMYNSGTKVASCIYDQPKEELGLWWKWPEACCYSSYWIVFWCFSKSLILCLFNQIVIQRKWSGFHGVTASLIFLVFLYYFLYPYIQVSCFYNF